jgi:hypothetical protein
MSDIEYSEQFEILLKNEAEISESMSILHSKSYQKYNRLSQLTNIPVIILTSLIGFFSPIPLFDRQDIILGLLSVFCGIIKTLDNYMDFTKRSQSHFMIGLSYKKISKFIQIQLSLEKENRIAAADLLNMIINDLQHITNSEPFIPDDIIKKFNIIYKDSVTKKPPICNGLTDIKIAT